MFLKLFHPKNFKETCDLCGEVYDGYWVKHGSASWNHGGLNHLKICFPNQKNMAEREIKTSAQRIELEAKSQKASEEARILKKIVGLSPNNKNFKREKTELWLRIIRLESISKQALNDASKYNNSSGNITLPLLASSFCGVMGLLYFRHNPNFYNDLKFWFTIYVPAWIGFFGAVYLAKIKRKEKWETSDVLGIFIGALLGILLPSIINNFLNN
jgi:hypothetical protein